MSRVPDGYHGDTAVMFFYSLTAIRLSEDIAVSQKNTTLQTATSLKVSLFRVDILIWAECSERTNV